MKSIDIDSRIVILLVAFALPALAHAAVVKAVEYLGDHVFLTANPAEIAALDGGRIKGWTRSGLELQVHDAPGPGLVPVCRFFSPRFAPIGAHLFTTFAEECGAVRSNPDWIDEGIAFYASMPEPFVEATTRCPTHTHALYRWYNGARGGISRHAWTPYGGDHDDNRLRLGGFAQSGWVNEGVGYADAGEWGGVDGIAFCVVALPGVESGFDRERVEAGHLDLVKGTRWSFASENGRVVSVAFAPTVEEAPHRHLAVDGGDRDGEATWDQDTGQLRVLLFSPGGDSRLPRRLILVSFTGRNRVEGCFYEQGAGRGNGWKFCELVVGTPQ